MWHTSDSNTGILVATLKVVKCDEISARRD